MKKINIFLACLICTITTTAQNLYIYKTDGTVYSKQTATIDSINFTKAQDTFYVHHIDTIKRYAVSDVDSLSFIAPSNTTETGVVINGVRWATRNVATPGTFATSAEDAGMFYQWNSKVGWPSTGDIGSITATNGTTAWNSSPSSDTWTAANDPSPAGWHVPDSAEIASLYNTAKVTQAWTTQNGVSGMKFTDIATKATLFLPASGYRYNYGGSIGDPAGSYGCYWSSSAYDSASAYGLDFNDSSAGLFYGYRTNGCAVRSVVE